MDRRTAQSIISLDDNGYLPKPVIGYRKKDTGEMAWIDQEHPVDLFAKVIEETAEAMRDFSACEARQALCEDEVSERYRHSFGEEVTDIITACTTLLNYMGFDVIDRAELVREVNEKNRKRGCHEAASKAGTL